jgi:hypothetical protein
MPRRDKPRCAVHESMESRGLTYEQAIELIRRHEGESLERVGWYAHLVLDDPASPTGFNCHSHGLEDGYGHPDFQVVFPLPEDVAGDILANLCDAVKAGRRFAEGEEASDIIAEYPVGFVAAEEMGRPVLRVILPDKAGTVARDAIAEAYAIQYRP